MAELYAKPLPAGAVIGESWEVSDRPGDVSIVSNGPLKGKDLRWLMEHRAGELLGCDARTGDRKSPGKFPLLVKILDAREKLSLQVHPPVDVAAKLGGEPKTEVWYVAEAEPGAELFVGLKRGVTRAMFEARIAGGTVEECFHRVKVSAGDAMFLPSGRVHSLGAGMVIFEIQQNSDTTYRVFDWNRVGLDGRPRELHVDESLESIDFEDFEPALVAHGKPGPVTRLVKDPLFSLDLHSLSEGSQLVLEAGEALIVGVIEGRIQVRAPGCEVEEQTFRPGQFCLLPASLNKVEIEAPAVSKFLVARTG